MAISTDHKTNTIKADGTGVVVIPGLSNSSGTAPGQQVAALYSNSAPALQAQNPLGAVNYVQAEGAATGGAVLMRAAGTDANISLGIGPKGTGKLKLFGLVAYADDTAALAAGLIAGDAYLKSGVLAVVGTSPTAPATPSNVPAGWVLAFTDDFNQAATTGVNALDATKWKQRTFGSGAATGGAAFNNNGNNLESTGTSLKVHVKKVGSSWLVDGFQQGYQNTAPGGAGYIAGYGEYHVEFEMRLSHAIAPGVGTYVAMWPASNSWTSEIDISETPGATKNQSVTTCHWDSTGGGNAS